MNVNIQLNRINDEFLFECSNSNGHTVLLDNITKENPQGVSPMENVLMAVAGCSSIDVIAILKKQRQDIGEFKVNVSADRQQVGDVKPFKNIHIEFVVSEKVDLEKAQKAAQLSVEKYCSVTKCLAPEIEITYAVTQPK